MKRWVLMFALLSGSAAAFAVDGGAVVGGAIGGGAGAAIGSEIGGRNGAIIGGAIGGATGAAVGSQQKSQPAAAPAPRQVRERERRYEDDDYREHRDNGRHLGQRKHRRHDD